MRSVNAIARRRRTRAAAAVMIMVTAGAAPAQEAVAADGMIALGQSNNSTFLRPVSSGTIHAELLESAANRTGSNHGRGREKHLVVERAELGVVPEFPRVAASGLYDMG